MEGNSLFSLPLSLRGVLILFSGGVSLYLLRRYYAGRSCKNTKRLDGRTVIITGGSSGIGKATARDLACRGAKVILACRNPVSAEAAAVEIANETGNRAIIPMELDLSSQKSVREFVESFLNNEASLHILINNAGIFFVPQNITEDGIESVFATNYLGHFLLTCLLLERLKSSAPSRIINVSSQGYSMVSEIDWNDVRGLSLNYSRFKSYAQSKLAMMLFTKELQRMLQNTDVSVFSADPGVARTAIFRTFPLYTNPILGLLQWPIRCICQKSAEEAAQTVIHCAVEDIEHNSGGFFSNCKLSDILPFAKDPVKAKELWTLSKQMCNLFEI